MEKIRITKADLNADNFYKEDYIDFNGHIEIEENLGRVKFKKGIKAKGFIFIKAGSGIKAGRGIEAGLGIEAGWGIKAGLGIEAGRGIKAGLGIEAGRGIEAGLGIEAGWGIKAGSGIKAGEGIKAGLSVICKSVLKFSYQLFAGVCLWRESKEEDKVVQCRELIGTGKIAYGNLKFLKEREKRIKITRR